MATTYRSRPLHNRLQGCVLIQAVASPGQRLFRLLSEHKTLNLEVFQVCNCRHPKPDEAH